MTNKLVLENYGVQEMQAVEQLEVDGGILLGPRFTPANALAVWNGVKDFFEGMGEGLRDCSCVNKK